MKRTALKRRTALRSKPGPGIKLDVLQALWRRSQGRCEARVFGCHGGADSPPHHRLRRSQGGKDTVENLLVICQVCHSFVHDHPTWAYNEGYMIRSTEQGGRNGSS